MRTSNTILNFHNSLKSIFTFLLIISVFSTQGIFAQGAEDLQYENDKMHQYLMLKYGFMDLPGLVLTGDPVQDNINYENTKTQWLKDNPTSAEEVTTTNLPPPTNDLCSGAIAIAYGSTTSGTTTGQTFDNVGFCGTSNTAPGVWYTFTGIEGTTTLSTCNQANYDTKISVFSGDCNGLICVDGQDDNFALCSFFTTSLDICLEAGVTYYVLVHGFAAATGDFDLTLTVNPIPPENENQLACGATIVSIGSTFNAAAIEGAPCGFQPGEVSPGPGTGASSCNSQDGWCSFETGVQNSLWFKFIPNASMTIDIFTDDTDDTQLALWKVPSHIFGDDCSDFTSYIEIAANDDDGPNFAPYIKEAAVMAGMTYYLQIDGFAGQAYDTNISIVHVAFIPTLSQWSILILSMIMLSVGIVALRQRRTIAQQNV